MWNLEKVISNITKHIITKIEENNDGFTIIEYADIFDTFGQELDDVIKEMIVKELSASDYIADVEIDEDGNFEVTKSLPLF